MKISSKKDLYKFFSNPFFKKHLINWNRSDIKMGVGLEKLPICPITLAVIHNDRTLLPQKRVIDQKSFKERADLLNLINPLILEVALNLSQEKISEIYEYGSVSIFSKDSELELRMLQSNHLKSTFLSERKKLEQVFGYKKERIITQIRPSSA